MGDFSPLLLSGILFLGLMSSPYVVSILFCTYSIYKSAASTSWSSSYSLSNTLFYLSVKLSSNLETAGVKLFLTLGISICSLGNDILDFFNFNCIRLTKD